MKLAPMKFGTYSWKYNPRKITFECEKSVNEMKIPFGFSTVQNMGRRNMMIKGEGELVGADCAEQFKRLFEVFRNSGVEVLTIPEMSGIYAVFESLEIIGEPKPDVLSYRFVFREITEKKQTEKESFTYAKDGQTLWDISAGKGISIDRLVLLNPDVKFPDSNLFGKRVCLC